MQQAKHLQKPAITGATPGKGLLCFALPLFLLVAFLGTQFVNLDSIGWVSGFSHPLMGWDHLITMLAVGIWAAQLRGKAIWLLPLAFVGVMSLGGLAGAAGLGIPSVDGVILLSCAVFSVLITRKIRFSNKINVLIVAFFAFFHGFAHGQEISTSASLISYTLGFMLATLLLHGAGILLAKLVVLVATCLLTVLFSNAALAKTAESGTDNITNNVIVNHYQNADSTKDFWFSIRQSSYAGSNLVNENCILPKEVNNIVIDKSMLSSGISKLTPQLSFLSCAQVLSYHSKSHVDGDYQLLTTTHADKFLVYDNAKMLHFYTNYSSDCSNLDFKNYYPKINHTPGRHFLSNGVGLNSPPRLFTTALSPLENPELRNTSTKAVEEIYLQLSFAKLVTYNLKTKTISVISLDFATLNPLEPLLAVIRSVQANSNFNFIHIPKNSCIEVSSSLRLLTLEHSVKGRSRYIHVGLTPASKLATPLPKHSNAKIQTYGLFKSLSARTFGKINSPANNQAGPGFHSVFIAIKDQDILTLKNPLQIY